MRVEIRKNPESGVNARFFFLTEAFVFHQQHSMVLEWRNKSEWIRLPVRSEGKTLFSLARSSFGGLDHSPGVSTETLSLFIESALQLASLEGYSIFRIRSYPACYGPENWQQQDEVLQRQGFRAVIRDINMHLDLQAPDFRTNLNADEYRYLNRADRVGWHFKRLDFENYITSAYEILLAARSVKGYPISMNLEELVKMHRIFPENYLLFGVFEGEKMISTAVCIRVNNEILYDFFHGDRPEYRGGSPVVYLIAELFQYAKSEGYRLLDLGICSSAGQRNTGLCRFKENLGGIESPKVIYEISL